MKYVIKLDAAKEIVSRSIKRVSAFLGFGVNAARNKEFKEYQLINVTLFQVIPDGLPDKEIQSIKENFEDWIIANALRELIESFSVYLDSILRACLLIATNKRILTKNKAKAIKNSFLRKGIKGKLGILRTQFNVFTDKGKYFDGLQQVRNCFSHRQGIVGIEDLDKNEVLRVVWWGVEIFAETESGKIISLMPPLPKDGIHIKEASTVNLKFEDKVKIYRLGEVIKLEPHDLAEICFFVHLATDEIFKATVNFAKESGVPIKFTKKTEGGE